MNLRAICEYKTPRSDIATNRQTFRWQKAIELRQDIVTDLVYPIISLMQGDWPQLAVLDFRQATFDNNVTKKPPAVAS